MRALAAAFTVLLIATVPAQAGVELITNGNFDQTSFTGSYQMNRTNVTGWATNGWADSPQGYSFIFAPGDAVGTGAFTPQFNGYLSLYGASNGGLNGNSWTGTSPTGGNFLASDGAYQTQPITQTVSGLTVGQKYLLSFYYAGAQQKSFSGATTEGWQVSFGSQTLSTAILNNASQGFTGWYQASMTFTATQTSQVLTFLALGTPSGQPPFSLLDSVSMQAIPEPGTLALLTAGLFTLSRLRRRQAAPASSRGR